MIEFRTLGTLDLRDPAGAKLAAVLAHPKRTALLAYLAVARPRGFHRRDTLLGLFWPESSQEHARASLRKAVHQLRRALGDAAIVGVGDEQLGLAPDQIWCDAVAFEEAIDRGDIAGAFELYHGPLLDGFFVSEAPDFERWLETERARLSTRAFDAAWQHADAQRAAKNTFDAAFWGRRAAALTPDDEGALRRLLTLLDRLGDRAGAVSVYEDFARRLRADYDAEPAAETQALLRDIKSRHVPHRASPLAITPPTPVALQPAISPQPSHTRVSSRAVLLATVALIVIAGGWTLSRLSRDSAPVPDAQQSGFPVTPSVGTVAVLPFAFQGTSDYRYLADGLASLLGTSLDGVAGLRALDPNSLRLPGADAASLDPTSAANVARRSGATSFISGSIVEVGGQLRVAATLYDATGTPKVVTRATAEDSASRLFAVVDRLAAQLVTSQQGEGPQRLAKLASVTTSSLPALKAYLEGEQRFRIGHYKEAVDAFQRAIGHDSTFALAHYRLAWAYSWSSDSMAHPAELQAIRYATRLSPTDRQLVDAFLPFVEGNPDEAEYRYRAILSTRPFESEASYPLGEVLFHFNPVRGRSILEARPMFERALTTGPTDSPLTHLLEIAAIEGNYTAFDTLLKGIAAGAHFDLVGRTVRAFTHGTEPDRQKVLNEIRATTDAEVTNIGRHMLFLLDDRVGAERVLGLLTEKQRPRDVRASGYVLFAHLEASAGRIHAADSALATALTLDRTRALQHAALLYSMPFIPFDYSHREKVRADLEHWSLPAPEHGHQLPAGELAMQQTLHDYVLGLVYIGTGRMENATHVAERMRQPSASAETRGLATAFSHGIRARVALEQRRWPDALSEVEKAIILRPGLELMGDKPFFIFAPERFLHAEALYHLERYDEALRWYSAFGEHSPFSRVFRPLAGRRMAGIYEKTGRRAEAIAAYERFIAAWTDCDAELRQFVEDARVRVSTLAAAQR